LLAIVFLSSEKVITEKKKGFGALTKYVINAKNGLGSKRARNTGDMKLIFA
jgi:hypothetical protein